MGKNKAQQKIDKALTDIDSIMTALNTYPDIEDAVLDKAQEQINKVMGKMFPTQLDFFIKRAYS